MSGGSFSGKDFSLFCELFDWNISYHYGIGKWEYEFQVKEARKAGPFDDRRLNELLYDVFCLIHAADYRMAGDIGDETFEADKRAFKAKWFKMPRKEVLKEIIDADFRDTAQRLYKEFGIYEEVADGDLQTETCSEKNC